MKALMDRLRAIVQEINEPNGKKETAVADGDFERAACLRDLADAIRKHVAFLTENKPKRFATEQDIQIILAHSSVELQESLCLPPGEAQLFYRVLLKAASELPATTNSSAVKISAWLKDKVALGLKGYEVLHPNSNKVLATLMGKNGLERRGYFKKVGPKLYSLMPAGRALIIPNDKPIQPRASKEVKEACKEVSKEVEAQFLGYFDSPTKHKVIMTPETVGLVDALAFWKISAQDTNINQKLTMVVDCLSAMEALCREREDVILSNGMALATKDIQSVRYTHEWLQDKFRRHLHLLINRNR